MHCLFPLLQESNVRFISTQWSSSSSSVRHSGFRHRQHWGNSIRIADVEQQWLPKPCLPFCVAEGLQPLF